MTPQEFYDACIAFDWRYERSDDPAHVESMRDTELRLSLVAIECPRCGDLWARFITHMYYAGPKPARPD